MFIPPTWNIGAAVRISSSAVIPKAVIEFSAFAVSASCVRTAPFAAPLVPDVYAIRTGAPPSSSGSAATGVASLTCASSPLASNRTTSSGERSLALLTVASRKLSSATRTWGSLCSTKTRSSAGGIRAFSGTKIAAIRADANRISRSSGQLGPR